MTPEELEELKSGLQVAQPSPQPSPLPSLPPSNIPQKRRPGEAIIYPTPEESLWKTIPKFVLGEDLGGLVTEPIKSMRKMAIERELGEPIFGTGTDPLALRAAMDASMWMGGGGIAKRFTTAPVTRMESVIMPVVKEKLAPIGRGLQSIIGTPESRVAVFNKLTDPLVNFPILPKGAISERLGGRTLKEMFVPAIERMPFMPSRMFEKRKVDTRKMSTALEELSSNLRTLSLEERGIVLKAFQTNNFNVLNFRPKEVQERILEAVKPLGDVWEDISSKMKPAQLNLLKDEFETRMQKLFFEADPTFLKEVKAVLPSNILEEGKISFKKSQQLLREVIENPAVGDNAKILAKEIYNLPAKTSLDVYNAFRESSEALLISKLKNTLDVSISPKPGYVVSNHEGLKGLWVEKNVEDGLKELRNIPTFAGHMWQRYFLSPWKILKVVARFPTQFRNAGSLFIQNDIFGAHPLSPLRQDVYFKALREMKTQSSLWEDFVKRTGVKAATWTATEFKPFEQSLKYGTSAFDVLFDSLMQRFMHPLKGVPGLQKLTDFQKIFNFIETWGKFTKYGWNLKKGMAPSDAAIDAMRASFDYGDVTRFTKRVRGSVAPFFTWQSKILQNLPQAMVAHPVRVMKYMAIPAAITTQALSRLNISNEEWKSFKEDLPDYIKNGWFMLLPFRDEKDRLQLFNLTWWVPGLGDISDIASGFGTPVETLTHLVQNPIMTLYSEIRSNRTRTGEKIYHEWEANNVKMMKLMQHIWSQLAPAYLPGGVDWNSLYKASRGEEKALTPSQAVAAQFGLKVTPMGEEEVYIKARFREKRSLEEMKSQAFKELGETVSEKEREDVIDRYASEVQRYLEKK